MVEIKSWKFNFQSQPSNTIALGAIVFNVLNTIAPDVNPYSMYQLAQ